MIAQLVRLPSFSDASAIALFRDFSGDPRETTGFTVALKVEGHKEIASPIDSETSALIARVFQTAVGRTRFPPKDRIGADGTGYHFWASGRAARTWSPDEGSALAALVEFGGDLAAYPSLGQAKRAEKQQALRTAAERLIERIRKAACAPAIDE
jgi:hypothetical protein